MLPTKELLCSFIGYWSTSAVWAAYCVIVRCLQICASYSLLPVCCFSDMVSSQSIQYLALFRVLDSHSMTSQIN
ncbi:unnamed protein product [Amaranthus hypochondriacus]